MILEKGLYGYYVGTTNSKINGTPISVHLPISKLYSILAVSN